MKQLLVQPAPQHHQHLAARGLGFVEDLVVQRLEGLHGHHAPWGRRRKGAAAGGVHQAVTAGKQQQRGHRPARSLGHGGGAGIRDEAGQPARHAVVAITVGAVGLRYGVVM